MHLRETSKDIVSNQPPETHESCHGDINIVTSYEGTIQVGSTLYGMQVIPYLMYERILVNRFTLVPIHKENPLSTHFIRNLRRHTPNNRDKPWLAGDFAVHPDKSNAFYEEIDRIVALAELKLNLVLDLNKGIDWNQLEETSDNQVSINRAKARKVLEMYRDIKQNLINSGNLGNFSESKIRRLIENIGYLNKRERKELLHQIIMLEAQHLL